MDEQLEVTLEWHELQTILYLIAKDIDATANPLRREFNEELFLKLYPLRKAGPPSEFVVKKAVR